MRLTTVVPERIVEEARRRLIAAHRGVAEELGQAIGRNGTPEPLRAKSERLVV